MNTQTRLSAKGQVVIPKGVRDRLGLAAGEAFDVFERGEDVVLRRRDPSKRLTMDEAIARFRAIYQHEGPPIPIEELSWRPLIDGAERRE